MILMLLTDDRGGRSLVICENEDQANRLGGAATFQDQDISSWRVPDLAVTNAERVISILEDEDGPGDIGAIVEKVELGWLSEMPVFRTDLG
jgi:hypothetical protein